MTNDVVLTDIFGTPFSLVDKRQAVSENTDKIFIIKPYLQLGRHFNEKPGSLVLFFHPGRNTVVKTGLCSIVNPRWMATTGGMLLFLGGACVLSPANAIGATGLN